MTTPSFVNVSAEAGTGFGTSLQPSAPASMVAGNLLLCLVFAPTGSDPDFSFPSPWTQIEAVNNSGNLNIVIAAAICTGSGMAMPTITWSSYTSAHSYVFQYSGNLTTLPAAVGNSNSAQDGSDSSTGTNPGMASSANDSLIVSFFVGDASGPSGTPTSYTSELATTYDNVEVADYAVATQGNSSPAISTALSSGTQWITAQIEVCSEVGGPPTITADPVITTLRAPTQVLEATTTPVGAITTTLKSLAQQADVTVSGEPTPPPNRAGSRRIFIIS